MKKIILFAACLFAVTTVTQAQEVPMKERNLAGTEKKGGNKLTPEQRAQKSVDALNAEVTLTDDQKPKVLALATTRVTNVDAIRAKYKGQSENKEVAKAEIVKVRKDYREGVKALLTAEQKEKLKAKHKEMKAAGKTNSLDAND